MRVLRTHYTRQYTSTEGPSPIGPATHETRLVVFKKLDEAINQPRSLAWGSLALPYDQNSPAQPLKLPPLIGIAILVRQQLLLPKCPPSFRHGSTFSATVSVPKTTMDENDFATPGKDQVGLSRQRGNVEPITVSEAVNEFADRHFRFSVTAADQSHNLPTLFFREYVGHSDSMILPSADCSLPACSLS